EHRGGGLGMASAYASPSARIYGGEPAPRIWKQKVPGRLGRFAASASSLATWPVRTHFAYTHGRDAWAYDEIVGVHFLGETFPGLNSVPPRTVDNRTIGQIPPTLRRGFAGSKDGYTIPDGRARIWVGLNRTGGVEVSVPLSHPTSTGEITVSWNGRVLTRGPASVATGRFAFRTWALERGVNTLVIDGPPGMLAHGLELRAIP
ncbi:MAG: hypothetical protein K8M05_02445, partial [Deltaproteobacteria bacterium]|nr:hypothetical protein [Kofleriaceae bacterium]